MAEAPLDQGMADLDMAELVEQPDIMPDLTAPDMDMAVEPPDMDMALPDPCASQGCGGHGTCQLVEEQPACVCDEGYAPRGDALICDPIIRLMSLYSASHVCAIKLGKLSCWGDNGSGQLGDKMGAQPLPMTPPGMDSGVQAVTLGSFHTCALKAGALSCWGRGLEGQLGDGRGVSDVRLVAPIGMDKDITGVVAGPSSVCAIKLDNPSCWGAAALALGPTCNASCRTAGKSSTPVSYSGFSSPVSRQFASGAATCSVITDQVYCWGDNSAGLLNPFNDKTAWRVTPQVILGSFGPSDMLALGPAHTCVLQAGDVKCWGDNSAANLGVGDRAVHGGKVTPIGLTRVSAISIGQDNACAIVEGKLYCWGLNEVEQLPLPINDNYYLRPTEVAGTVHVTDVVVGANHTCYVDAGQIKCAGNIAGADLNGLITLR